MHLLIELWGTRRSRKFNWRHVESLHDINGLFIRIDGMPTLRVPAFISFEDGSTEQDEE